MNVSRVIDQTVSAIHSAEEKRKSVGRQLSRFRGTGLGGILDYQEGRLSFPIQTWVPEGKIAGVDSGFVAKRIAGIDLVLIRTMGVVFDYRKGKVLSAEYYPDYFHFPEPHMSASALEHDEVEQSRSLMRLLEELSAAKQIMQHHHPAYLFIDGSIVPQYQDKPRRESALTGRYSDIISEFESLYSAAEKTGCTLIAAVEDSRGSRFRQILQEEVLAKHLESAPDASELDGMLDSSILDYFLDVGERSCAFTYTKSVHDHPVLQDFNSKWSTSIYGLYIKPVPLDRPLRIEFICHGGLREKADEVASVALALSSFHREYAFPSVLTEADFHARLSPGEIDIVFNKILDKLGGSMRLKMRRENRPF